MKTNSRTKKLVVVAIACCATMSVTCATSANDYPLTNSATRYGEIMSALIVAGLDVPQTHYHYGSTPTYYAPTYYAPVYYAPVYYRAPYDGNPQRWKIKRDRRRYDRLMKRYYRITR